VSTLADIDAMNIQVYKDILDSTFSALNLTSTSSSVDEQNFKAVQLYYDACMNETEINQAGILPLQETIAQLVELWPLSQDDYNQDTSVTEADIDFIAKSIAFLEQLHIEPFQKFDVFINDAEPVCAPIQMYDRAKITFRVSKFYVCFRYGTLSSYPAMMQIPSQLMLL
jgi:hypothetical protein